jgi:chromosome partitioning protein
MAGLRVKIYDLDPQESVAKWAALRPADVSPVTVQAVPIGTVNVRYLFEGDDGNFDLVLVDTPPGVEEVPAQIAALIDRADFIVVPSRATADDEHSVVPFMRYIRSRGKRAAFLINQVRKRTTAIDETKAVLVEAGPLLPVEIPLLEDIARASRYGLACADVEGMPGTEEYRILFGHLRHELGL